MTFVDPTVRGVGGARRGLAIVRPYEPFGMCSLPGPLVLPLLLVDRSDGIEFKLRSDSGAPRLDDVSTLSPFSSSSARLPRVDDPRAFRKPGSRRLKRLLREGPVMRDEGRSRDVKDERLKFRLSSVFSSSQSLSEPALRCEEDVIIPLSSDAGVIEMEGLRLLEDDA